MFGLQTTFVRSAHDTGGGGERPDRGAVDGAGGELDAAVSGPWGTGVEPAVVAAGRADPAGVCPEAGEPSTMDGMVSSDPRLRAQLDRARHLLHRQQVSAAAAGPGPLPVASRVEQVEHAHAAQQLPAPLAGSVVRTATLCSGRAKLTRPLRETLGWTPDTELVAVPHGCQLLVTAVHPRLDAVGGPIRLDAQQRLHLAAGHRQLLGVTAAALVLLAADPASRVLRILDPARVHALLLTLTATTLDTPTARGPTWLS
jgi:hypothetical protein